MRGQGHNQIPQPLQYQGMLDDGVQAVSENGLNWEERQKIAQ